MIHGSEPINWVYEVRQRMAVYILHHENKIDPRELTYLEDELFPAMDEFVKLCASIDEERELQEQAQLDHAHEERLVSTN